MSVTAAPAAKVVPAVKPVPAVKLAAAVELASSSTRQRVKPPLTDRPRKLERVMFMGALIIAGEAVFSLPFHVARFFRPTVLQVLGLSNTELGAVQGYGMNEVEGVNVRPPTPR